MSAEDDTREHLLDELREHLENAELLGLPRAWFENHSEEDQLGAAEEKPLTPVAGNLFAEGNQFDGLSLDELRDVALECRRCRLCEGRSKVVFGVGRNVQPIVAFVGEGPGADEDRVGEPFVGRAGQLLTAAITQGMGIRREDVYICNVVKCRPPENRTPLPDEVEACTPYLYRQLELVQPRVIVTLGQPAQLALSGIKLGITKLRGQWQSWRGIKLMPTFHPAYLLRNPPAKREFWLDLQAVMNEVGLPMKRTGV